MSLNGGRTIDERERAIIDLIAQRLGTAMSVQSSWRTFDMDWSAGDGLSSRSVRDSEHFAEKAQYLSVLWRDRRNPMLPEDKDKKGDQGDEVDTSLDHGSGVGQTQRVLLAKRASAILKKAKQPEPRKWCHGYYQISPRIRRDLDAIAAMGFAKLAVPHEAILMLYATEDVSRYWPVVKRYGLRGNTSPAHVHAITDAMQAILFGNAELAQDKRAQALHMRASSYRAIRADYLSLLWGWIRRAADAYSRSLTGLSIGQVWAAMGRAAQGLPGVLPSPTSALASLQTTTIKADGPANEVSGRAASGSVGC